MVSKCWGLTLILLLLHVAIDKHAHRNRQKDQKGWWRILHVSTLLSWKWLRTMESDIVNYQKRYLAISWNTISSFMFACKAWNAIFHCPSSHLDNRVLVDSNFFLFFPYGMPKAIPLAIPLLTRYRHRSTLSPKRFPQVFVCAVMSTASRPHVACIRQEPTIWTGNHKHRQLRFSMYNIQLYLEAHLSLT